RRRAGAVVDQIAGGAEALPHRVRLIFRRRADGLPLGLHLPDLGERGLDVVGLLERLDLLAEQLLLLEVAGALLVELVEVGLARVEEAIAGGAEAVPVGLLALLARRANLLPGRLQPLELVRRVLPVDALERLGGDPLGLQNQLVLLL